MHGAHCTERHIIVTGKNRRHGNALLQQLLNLGHRHIACITSPLVSETGKIRYQVYQQALHEQGIELSSSLVIEGDNTLLGGYQAMQQLLQQGISMTAVFA
ncbi:substrate-binding domain-containing protein, partial [Vibrio cholerae]|uniref:substrate-binding domain-containing protein n=1 Tax=Vibrio cholerae TaxID=666 RepID=UPI003C6F9089